MLSISSYPRAILHVDGDSFFASCEIAVNPALRGKPVVTGKERGIASSMTYDLKTMGVKRAMPLHEIKKICPDVIILPSDYETYSLFSMRMYEIVRRYTPSVEEYSIDECFADLTGLRRSLRMSYEEMAKRIKYDLEHELGITFSVGLAPTKVLAKVASKWQKPAGMTCIPGKRIAPYLRTLPIDAVWGIGKQTGAYLRGLGVHTALMYATKSREWIDAHMSKPYREIYAELRGESVYQLFLEKKDTYASITKSKTFTPPSKDKEYVFSQLSKNIENACIKARRHGLAPKKFFYYLRTQEFRHVGMEHTLVSPLSAPHEIIRMAQASFSGVYTPRTLYRATGVVLTHLDSHEHIQLDLFGDVARDSKWQPVYDAIDALDARFGKHSVYLGSTYTALTTATHLEERGDVPTRAKQLMRGENKRQRINIPMLGDVL
jgi:DNA polymerase-4/DNA polymerase V